MAANLRLYISTGGALLESSRALPDGAHVQLDLPGCGQLGAEVRWTEHKRMGIQFEEEFDLRRLAPSKGTGFGAKLAQQSYRPLELSDRVEKEALRASDLRY